MAAACCGEMVELAKKVERKSVWSRANQRDAVVERRGIRWRDGREGL